MNKPDWVLSRQRVWGVPLTLFVRETADGSSRCCATSGSNAAHRRHFRARGRRRLVRAGRARPLPRRTGRRSRGVAQGRRYRRRLVRFRLHPCLHPRSARGPQGQPQDPRRARQRDVSRRLRPASRLVPVLADGELRHARRRALSTSCSPTASSSTRRASTRCRSRAATSPRRWRSAARTAPISCGCGPPPPTMPTTSASAPRSSRTSSRPTGNCATRCAGCSAISRICARRTASSRRACPSSSA